MALFQETKKTFVKEDGDIKLPSLMVPGNLFCFVFKVQIS